MKKYFLRIFLLSTVLFCSAELSAQWELKTNLEDGKYSLVTNSDTYFGISSGNILSEAILMLTPSDTSAWRLVSNTDNGLYSLAENKITFMGVESGKIKTRAVYILNPSTLTSLGLDTTRLAYLSKSNSFIGRKQEFDTVNATVKYLLNGGDINTAGVLSNVAYLNQANIFSANTKISGHLAVNTSGINPIPFLAVGMTSGDSNIVGLNVVSTTFNTVRNSQAQATDTSSINLGLTQWTNTPYFNMVNKNGAMIFNVDTSGRVLASSFLMTGGNLGAISTTSNNLFMISGGGRDLLLGTGTAGTIWTFQSALGNVTFAPLAVTGSATTSALDMSQTWNTSGSPTALKLNITNTSSGSNAKLFDFQVNSSSKLSLDKNGMLHLSGDFRWDGTTSTTATEGSGSALPVTPQGYISINIGGTNYKIPYYLN